MKNFYPIQVIDLRIQIDHVNPKKMQLFEEYRGEPDKAQTDVRLINILIRRRELKKMFQMKIKQMKIEFFKMTILNLKDFILKKKLRDDSMNESDLKKVYLSNISQRFYNNH